MKHTSLPLVLLLDLPVADLMISEPNRPRSTTGWLPEAKRIKLGPLDLVAGLGPLGSQLDWTTSEGRLPWESDPLRIGWFLHRAHTGHGLWSAMISVA